jgi:hypothetical protein
MRALQQRTAVLRSPSRRAAGGSPSGALRCRRKFLRIFPKGFYDPTYLAFERDYKWDAHKAWTAQLDRVTFQRLIRDGEFVEAALRAIKIEARTNLIFSFEKMALRDAVKSSAGARAFTAGLYEFLYGAGGLEARFDRWCAVVSALPRKQTRVLTWPVLTVFGFIAQPRTHFFIKPNVTRVAARAYGIDFRYKSRPSWETYASALAFAGQVRRDLADLRPRDMIDIQSFLWVQGSDEYAE